MIPLPFEYITMRAHHVQCLFLSSFLGKFMLFSVEQKCWLQQCNWKRFLCRSRALLNNFRVASHPSSHYSINNKSNRISSFMFSTFCRMLSRSRWAQGISRKQKTCMVELNLRCLTPYFLRIHLGYDLQLFIIMKIHSLWDINPQQIEFSSKKQRNFTV